MRATLGMEIFICLDISRYFKPSPRSARTFA
jgi:hypothetical protein